MIRKNIVTHFVPDLNGSIRLCVFNKIKCLAIQKKYIYKLFIHINDLWIFAGFFFRWWLLAPIYTTLLNYVSLLRFFFLYLYCCCYATALRSLLQHYHNNNK